MRRDKSNLAAFYWGRDLLMNRGRRCGVGSKEPGKMTGIRANILHHSGGIVLVLCCLLEILVQVGGPIRMCQGFVQIDSLKIGHALIVGIPIDIPNKLTMGHDKGMRQDIDNRISEMCLSLGSGRAGTPQSLVIFGTTTRTMEFAVLQGKAWIQDEPFAVGLQETCEKGETILNQLPSERPIDQPRGFQDETIAFHDFPSQDETMVLNLTCQKHKETDQSIHLDKRDIPDEKFCQTTYRTSCGTEMLGVDNRPGSVGACDGMNFKGLSKAGGHSYQGSTMIMVAVAVVHSCRVMMKQGRRWEPHRSSSVIVVATTVGGW